MCTFDKIVLGWHAAATTLNHWPYFLCYRFQKTFDTLALLIEEKNTWQLVNSLFKDRLETEMRADLSDEEMAIDGMVGRLSL